MSDRIEDLFVLFKQINPKNNFYTIRKALTDFQINLDKKALLTRLRKYQDKKS